MISGNELSSEFLAQFNQFNGNQKIDDSNVKDNKDNSSRYDNCETYLLRLPKGTRNLFKAFCATHGISLNCFFYLSAETMVSLVDERKTHRITQYGVKEINRI